MNGLRVFLLLPFFLTAFCLSGCGDDSNSLPDEPEPPDSERTFWEGSFEQQEKAFVETSDGNWSTLFFRDDMMPFSGTLTSHGPEGERRVFRYLKGKKHGLCVLRDKSGGRTEANYRNGVEHGSFVIFGRDGGERFRWRYEEGRRVEAP